MTDDDLTAKLRAASAYHASLLMECWRRGILPDTLAHVPGPTDEDLLAEEGLNDAELSEYRTRWPGGVN